MKKTLFILPILVGIFFCSCTKGTVNNTKTINDLISYFKQNGLKVDNVDVMMFQIIGASDGKRMNINNTEIEVYKFDSDDKGQQTILNDIEKTGTINVLNMKEPAIINGSFIIISYEDHPDKQKIIQLFKKFK